MLRLPDEMAAALAAHIPLEDGHIAGPQELLQALAGLEPARLVEAADAAGALAEAFELLVERHATPSETPVDARLLVDSGRHLAKALGQEGGRALEPAAWALLDLVRRPPSLEAIVDAGLTDAAFEMIVALARASRFNLWRLFEQRVRVYGPRTLFRVPSRGERAEVSWLEVEREVERIARGILALEPRGGRAPVALLSANRLEMAYADLACLTSGIVNVMLPPALTDDDVAYVLGKTGARLVLFSGDEAQRRLLRVRGGLSSLGPLVRLDPAPAHAGVTSLAELIRAGRDIPADELALRRANVDLSELASIMVTSGTTGRPKGIRFSVENLVSKRFARALALPDIGDRDVFLCYLPLFHTFGRYLEMLGCIFWGATYVFLRDPSLYAMREAFRNERPSVFISIPKKWIQLHEEIGEKVDVEHGSDEAQLAATREVVGERLRYGLSAAGFLDPEIFRFFQRQGVELMSGFGMTEATGGITMTPPGEYRDESLGVPLPGIEVRLAEDGEMLVRGSYVMEGYIEEEDQQAAVDDEGWLRTGDLMEQSPEGHYRILDRKKEIYKNVKGQTVAPARIEKLFADFEAVQRAFLVGDHREFNTALIVPNFSFRDVPIASVSEEERRAYFRSIVVSVNGFLPPYERVVDFAVLDRDFEEARGELTPKGTYKRRQIVDNFAELIEPFYRRVPLRLPRRELDVRLPSRLFQELGVTSRDARLGGGALSIGAGRRLALEEVGGEQPNLVRIGSMLYRIDTSSLDLGQMLTCPELWLGNDELVAFCELDERSKLRRRHAPPGLEMLRRMTPAAVGEEVVEALREAARREHVGVDDLHRAALALLSTSIDAAHAAVDLLASVPPAERAPIGELSHFVLRLAAEAPLVEVRRRAFAALLPVEEDERALMTMEHFLVDPEEILDEETIAQLARPTLSTAVLDALVVFTCRKAQQPDAPLDEARWQGAVSAMLRLLGRYGAEHPVAYRALRRDLARLEAFSEDEVVREEARRARERLMRGFRRWLGPPQWIAVDPDSGREYRWRDAITFEEDMPERDRERLLEAFRATSLVREAVFLLGGGQTVRLSDIPPQGVWISLHRSEASRVTYRVTVHTRFMGAFDFCIGLTRSMSSADLEREFTWALIAGEARDGMRLVEEMGGSYPEQGVWTKEFVHGETVDRALRRLDPRRSPDGIDRQRPTWPFMVWSAAEAFFDFWRRTNRRYVIRDCSLSNVIVPTHDYQVGARIVSLSSRTDAPGVAPMIASINERLIVAGEREYEGLRGLAGVELIFNALVEVLGVGSALSMLRHLESDDAGLVAAARRYAEEVDRRGFIPRRLYFAIERYRRWEELAEQPSARTKAQMLSEITQTYNLPRLAGRYPEARVRFFRETVFRDAAPALLEGLDRIATELRTRRVEQDELIDMISHLERAGEPGSETEFFFTRLMLPHLGPSDEAGFVSAQWGGARQSDVVVTYYDNLGQPFRVRHPVTPKEVGRLHRLFLAARMEVTFTPEHYFLVAVNERGHLIGGLFYDLDDAGNGRAHLEKIVVAERYRRLGVADGLMRELFNRLGAQGLRTVTTGFYRPSYFYRHGFRVERRYAGLARSLEPEAWNPEIF